MALPSNVSTGTVTGQFVVAVADGSDSDYDPDTYPVGGTVTFTPSVPYLPDPSGGVTILASAITGIFDGDGYLCTPDPDNSKVAGRRGVQLIATDDPDLSVTGWTWKVSYAFAPLNKVALPQVPPHDILVPSGGTVDLTSAVKVPSSTGVGLDQVTIIRAEALQAAADADASADLAGARATDAAGFASASAGSASAAAATSADFQAQANNPASSWWATFVAFLRTLFVAKGAEVINVKDYGAKGDGTTNDAAAIQAVLNLAQTTPIKVLFPNGTYGVGQKLYVYSNTTLDLGGSTIRRSFNTGPGGVSLIEFSSVSNLTIRNGTLDGNGANYPGNAGAEGFNIIGGNGITDALFENITFKDVVGDHALDLGTINRVKVDNCKFLGFKDVVGDRPFSESIQLDPNIITGTGSNNTKFVLTRSYFGPSTTAGFGAPGVGIGNHASVAGRTDTDIKIVNNTFDGCGYAGVRPYKWDKVKVTGNTFINCLRGVYVVPFSNGTAAPESGSGYTLSGNDFSGCTSPIQFVAPLLGTGNTYSRFKNVTIAGNTFDGGTDGLTLPFITQLAVSGNTFSNMSTAIKLGYTDGATVAGNTANNLTSNFLWITESFDAVLPGTGLTQITAVSGNTASNIGFRGVHVNCAAKFTTIVGNTFVNVSTIANTREGIGADSGANGGIIEGNTIQDGGATIKPLYGINISSGASNFRIGANNAFGTTRGTHNASTTTTLTGVLVTGTPEGVITGAVGSTVTRTDGGASTTLYVKQSGTGNTGWIAK